MSNPTGLYSIVKTWGTTDTILAADLNAEFNNVLNNFNPQNLAGYSQNQAQMQIQTSPGAVGSESLATSISGEIERIRFAIAAITGNTYWYSSPAATLAQLNSIIGAAAFGNRISSGLTSGTTGSVMPAFLVAAGTGTVATLKATATAFAYQIAGVPYTISADTTVALTLGGTGATYNATVADLTLPAAGTQSTNVIGENGSQITVSSMGGSMSAVVGQLVGLKTTAGEYLLGRVESATQITNCVRGYFFDSTSALVSRGTISNGDILQLMGTSWIFANTGGTVSAVYNREPKAGGVAPATPASGDYWYDTSVNLWKTYTGTTWSTANATLIGIALCDSSNCVATRSFEFFANYSDLNNAELFADSQNSGTVVRSRFTGAQVSVYGNILNFPSDYIRWDFSSALDTGAQAASTTYYFYLDTNGRSWISKVAPNDRRNDLRGYYHPGKPWRCLGWGYSNAGTLIDNVESFFRTDDATPVSNITAANNNIILPYNIIQKETVITLTGAGGAFTQVLPPPAQIKGKYITYVRTDNNIANVVTLQSWGTAAVANITGTISATASQTVISGASSTAGIAAGMLISGPGITPNSLVTATSAAAVTMSNNAYQTNTAGTFSVANCAGYSGTVGQQTAYINYGINGAFTTTLNTQYEAVTITSDGYAYFIRNRTIPSVWTNAGTISFSATTTPGTKGTNTTDRISWRRVGQYAEIQVAYVQSAAGTSGSGDYIVNLPTNLTVDTNNITLYTTVVGNATGYHPSNRVGDGSIGYSGTVTAEVTVSLLTATSVKCFGNNGAAVNGAWCSASNAAFSDIRLTVCLNLLVPIVGWNAQ